MTKRMILRLLSLAFPVAPVLYDTVSGRFCPERLCYYILTAAILAAFHPFATDSGRQCLITALAYASLALAVMFTGLPLILLVPLSVSFLVFHAIRRSSVRLQGLRQYSGTLGVWHCMEDYVWMFYIMVCAASAALIACGALWWPKTVLALALLSALQYRAWTSNSLFFTKAKEVRLKELSRECGCFAQQAPDPRMNALYSRILTAMEEKKPYLDDSFSMTDLSRLVYANPSYVSKAINSCAGFNFSRFTNGYRVDYAMDLVRHDPHLKMVEVATMAGFHNVVSFNNSFKGIVGKTPTEFQREVRLESVGHPSNSPAPEQ